MADLTQQDVISWLRARAKRLNEAADALDEMGKSATTNGNGTVTLEMIRTRLLKGHSRVPQLAKEFRVDQLQVRNLVSKKDSGILIGTRGWLKLTGELEAKKS